MNNLGLTVGHFCKFVIAIAALEPVLSRLKGSQWQQRGLLEADAAGVVALSATASRLEELQTLHHELEASCKPEKLDRDRFFEINERFHMRLLALANNRWRDQMVADLRKVMKLNRHNSLLKSGRIEESLNGHRAVMTALLARDAALATQHMQEHFKSGPDAAR